MKLRRKQKERNKNKDRWRQGVDFSSIRLLKKKLFFKCSVFGTQHIALQIGKFWRGNFLMGWTKINICLANKDITRKIISISDKKGNVLLLYFTINIALNFELKTLHQM